MYPFTKIEPILGSGRSHGVLHAIGKAGTEEVKAEGVDGAKDGPRREVIEIKR